MEKNKLKIIVKKRLVEIGKSQRWLADEMGISASHLNHYVSGRRMSGKRFYSKIAGILGIEKSEVLFVAGFEARLRKISEK